MSEEVWYVNTSQGAPLTLFSGQSSETSVGPQRAVSFCLLGRHQFYYYPAMSLVVAISGSAFLLGSHPFTAGAQRRQRV